MIQSDNNTVHAVISRQQAVAAAHLRAWIDSPRDYKLECLRRYRERHPSFVIPRELLSPPPTLQPVPAHPSTNAQEGIRGRRQRKPTLTSVSKQASRAGIEVARYEIKPDGTIVVVTGKSEAIEPNPWLDDLKVTKQ